MLKNLDVDLRKVRLEVEKLVKSGPDMVTMGKLPADPAGQEGHRVRDRRGPQPEPQLRRARSTCLLGLLREHDGVAAQVLMNLA